MPKNPGALNKKGAVKSEEKPLEPREWKELPLIDRQNGMRSVVIPTTIAMAVIIPLLIIVSGATILLAHQVSPVLIENYMMPLIASMIVIPAIPIGYKVYDSYESGHLRSRESVKSLETALTFMKEKQSELSDKLRDVFSLFRSSKSDPSHESITSQDLYNISSYLSKSAFAMSQKIKTEESSELRAINVKIGKERDFGDIAMSVAKLLGESYPKKNENFQSSLNEALLHFFLLNEATRAIQSDTTVPFKDEAFFRNVAEYNKKFFEVLKKRFPKEQESIENINLAIALDVPTIDPASQNKSQLAVSHAVYKPLQEEQAMCITK